MIDLMKQRIDDLITRDLNYGAFVGANAAVYRDGACLYSGSFGMADRENGVPMQPDSIFRIYSMTKPVTAAAVMQLVERGILEPQFPVSQFIPEFADPKVYNPDGTTRPAAREITIQDLLNMRSGLAYPNCETQTQKDTASFFGEIDVRRDGDNPVSTLELCKRIAVIPLQFDPGTQWDYGVSADILGGVIEAATGMNYRDYLMQNIFLPLGMTDTDFYVPEEKLHRFAAAYEFDEDRNLRRDDGCHLGLNDRRTLPAFISGGAGLCSTIGDYAKFANTLANGGVSKDGVRILSRKSVEYIRTPQVDPVQLAPKGWDSLKGYAYGSLVRVLVNKAEFGTLANLGEFGWDGWTGTYFTVDPEEKLVIMFWIQVACAGTSATAKLMRNIVYGCI